jgi:phosphoserine phosphatase
MNKKEMKIKVALIDFDGTIVDRSMLDWLCSLVGKEKESRDIGLRTFQGKFSGLEPLVERINLLKGLSIQEIKNKLPLDLCLRTGVENLFEYFRKNNIITVLHSGNVLPLLEIYQKRLNIDYIIGSRCKVEAEVISGIEISSYSSQDYKLRESQKIVRKHNCVPSEALALGDSPSDKAVFEYAGLSIAVNPLFGIEKYADFTVTDDLNEIIKILEMHFK